MVSLSNHVEALISIGQNANCNLPPTGLSQFAGGNLTLDDDSQRESAAFGGSESVAHFSLEWKEMFPIVVAGYWV